MKYKYEIGTYSQYSQNKKTNNNHKNELERRPRTNCIKNFLAILLGFPSNRNWNSNMLSSCRKSPLGSGRLTKRYISFDSGRVLITITFSHSSKLAFAPCIQNPLNFCQFSSIVDTGDLCDVSRKLDTKDFKNAGVTTEIHIP